MNSKRQIRKWGGYLVLGFAVASGCIAYPYLRFTLFDSDMPLAERHIQVIGHRGAAAVAPENTLAAFAKAIPEAEVIELDVHLTRDDSVVVMHDATVDRTTDGKGAIADLTYARIAGLDAGLWFDEKFNGERVPTLAQVLDLVNGARTVLIELKWPDKGIYKNLVARVVELVRERNAEPWVIVQSFEYEYLQQLRRLAPDITAYQLLYGYLSFPPVYMDRSLHLGTYPMVEGVKGLAINYKFLSPSLVESLHRQGLKVVTWTVNDPSDLRRVANLGVDGIISDNPELVNNHLNK